MMLSPVPVDLAELYPHMTVEMLSRHLDAVIAALTSAGVAITPVAQVGLEEIAEAVIEHHARHDVPALRRHLSLVGASDAHTASAPGMQQARNSPVHAPGGTSLTRSALRPREAAQSLGVSQRKLAKMLKSGELRSVKFGWSRRIPMDAIEEILNGKGGR